MVQHRVVHNNERGSLQAVLLRGIDASSLTTRKRHGNRRNDGDRTLIIAVHRVHARTHAHERTNERTRARNTRVYANVRDTTVGTHPYRTARTRLVALATVQQAKCFAHATRAFPPNRILRYDEIQRVAAIQFALHRAVSYAGKKSRPPPRDCFNSRTFLQCSTTFHEQNYTQAHTEVLCPAQHLEMAGANYRHSI